jgi:hypothetical protein
MVITFPRIHKLLIKVTSSSIGLSPKKTYTLVGFEPRISCF